MLDKAFGSKYFSVLFNIFFFVVPLGATTCASMGGLSKGRAKTVWVSASIILALVGAVLAAIEKRHSKTQSRIAGNMHDANAAIIDSLEFIAERISQLLECWDMHSRVTVYAAVKRGGEVVLCPLARRSYNPDLSKEGRTFCRADEGMLSSLWRGEGRGMAKAVFPVDRDEREHWYVSQYHMDEDTARGLTMYPISMFGVRLEYNREPVGALLFECDDQTRPARFDADFMDGYESNSAVRELVNVLQSEIYAVRTIIPGLIHHETYHSMPEVPVGMLPEKKS